MMEDSERIEDLRGLPAVGALLARPAIVAMTASLGHTAVVQAVREAVALAREELRAGRPAVLSELAIRRRATAIAQGLLRPVLNATGILVHTNLGRVTLADEAIEAMRAVAAGYSTLEYELDAGRRGHRSMHLAEAFRTLTGAEDAVVVNNNAAALLLALGSAAAGREVIVSRGELVEIGGGFRIPEVVGQSGARLVEVGTTNRTHLADYQRAITPATALLLKVHQSNFAMLGFTAEVDVPTLAGLARERGLGLVYDAGSGALSPIAERIGEPAIPAMVAAGADLVTFSGDKLLGGPQAGIAVGKSARIDAMRRAPLYRALRPDKLTIAALSATLTLWRDGPERIPLVQMVQTSPEELEARVDRLLERAFASGVASAGS